MAFSVFHGREWIGGVSYISYAAHACIQRTRGYMFCYYVLNLYNFAKSVASEWGVMLFCNMWVYIFSIRTPWPCLYLSLCCVCIPAYVHVHGSLHGLFKSRQAKGWLPNGYFPGSAKLWKQVKSSKNPDSVLLWSWAFGQLEPLGFRALEPI